MASLIPLAIIVAAFGGMDREAAGLSCPPDIDFTKATVHDGGHRRIFPKSYAKERGKNIDPFSA